MAGELVWRCEECGEERPATEGGHHALRMHEKGHGKLIRLVNRQTGAQVASGLADARAKGCFDSGEQAVVPAIVDDDGGDVKTATDGEAYIGVKVYLPSSIFTLYRYAKKAGISEHEDVVAFLCEYAMRGFKEVHGAVLTLAVEPDSNGSEREMIDLKQLVAIQGEAITDLSKKFEVFLTTQGGK
jgi:hypothetical protein